jgi:hypothetical protein
MRMNKVIERPKHTIHTTIPTKTYNILIELGDGLLNDGIEKAVDLAMRKQYTVHEELQKIASHILNNYSLPDSSENWQNTRPSDYQITKPKKIDKPLW